MIFGGCPYRVTSVRPVAELHWEVRGVGLPVHPEPGRHLSAGGPGVGGPDGSH